MTARNSMFWVCKCFTGCVYICDGVVDSVKHGEAACKHSNDAVIGFCDPLQGGIQCCGASGCEQCDGYISCGNVSKFGGIRVAVFLILFVLQRQQRIHQRLARRQRIHQR